MVIRRDEAEARFRACTFGTYPSSITAASIFSRISGETFSGTRSARDAVIVLTPTKRATSARVLLPVLRRRFSAMAFS